jgi:hypothetical protein
VTAGADRAHGGSGGAAASGQPGSLGSTNRSLSASSLAATDAGSGLCGRSNATGSHPAASRPAVTAGNGPGVAASASITSRNGRAGVHQPGGPATRARPLPIHHLHPAAIVR